MSMLRHASMILPFSNLSIVMPLSVTLLPRRVIFAVQRVATLSPSAIRLRRQRRGMTAAELARRAGLSKATLSGLEAGSGNPTIDTLEAVAVALHLPLTDLLVRDTDAGPVHVVATPGPADEPTYELLRRLGSGHSLELWRLRMAPHSSLDGIPHTPGTVEHLIVAAGSILAGPVDDPRLLHQGDLLAFAGDQPHHYHTDDEPADVTVVFASPAVG